ncbi:MAG TPA: DUF4136 domain-containing protein [Rudaea sp.]|nr:DUF4136 domain-containing protein [Rudaea sp.]
MTLRFATVRSFFVAMAFAGLVAGCGPSISVRTDFHPGTNFSVYKTVTISDAKTELDPFIAERIRQAVATQLATKGISRVPSDGDLVMHAHVRLRTDTTVSTWSGGWGYGYYGGNYVDVRNVRVGTLVVDLVDRAKGEAVWRGIAEGTIDQNSTPQESEAHINAAVEKLFREYPPKS